MQRNVYEIFMSCVVYIIAWLSLLKSAVYMFCYNCIISIVFSVNKDEYISCARMLTRDKKLPTHRNLSAILNHTCLNSKVIQGHSQSKQIRRPIMGHSPNVQNFAC